MTTKINDYFIWYKDNAISPSFCKHVIEKFKKSKDKRRGVVGRDGIIADIKKSTDLYISDKENWLEEIKVLNDVNKVCFDEYNKHVHAIDLPTDDGHTKCDPFIFPIDRNAVIIDSGHNVQETKPSDYYSWHSDWACDQNGTRYITYIHYLNTVDEGWTQFYNKSQVAPVAGRVLMFPATWQMIHRGFPPKQTKYISTGWIIEAPQQRTTISNGWISRR